MPLIATAYLVFVAGLLFGYAQFGVVATCTIGIIGATILSLSFARPQSLRLGIALVFSGAVALAFSESVQVTGGQGSHIPSAKVQAGFLVTARERASQAIERTFREDAPLAKALLVADRQQIPIEMNDAFVAAGLVHILSISGLHVGIIAMAITLLLESARIPRRISAMMTLCTVVAYVAILGWQPPALRAATMVCAVTIGRISQRPTSPWALLAIGAFIPLGEPRIVANLGYQLSVAGMAALIASGSFHRRWLNPKFSGLRLKLVRELSTSVLATIVTAPIIAWAFGRISLVGPISNIVATPIVAVLQPLLFLALLLAPVPPLARFVADAAHPLLRALDACAHLFGSFPGASVDVTPSWISAVLFTSAACALLVAVVSRFPARPLIAGAACCAAAIVLPTPVVGSGLLEMHMLDVGQGDAVLLRTPRGDWIAVDAGKAWPGGDAGRSVIVPYIRKRGGQVAAFILSHPHLDHVGGASTVLRALHPEAYWDAAFAGGNTSYRKSLAVAVSEKISWRRVHPGDSLLLDGVTVNFLAPDSTWTSRLTDANEASTVILVRYGMVRFLLTGDAERDEENWLQTHSLLPLRADVLKVGHHGSSTSTSDSFIDRVCPRVALISVGALNSYSHPSRDVIAALENHGALVLRTDLEGTIVVRSDGHKLEVQTAGQHWALSPPRPDYYSALASSCPARSWSGIPN